MVDVVIKIRYINGKNLVVTFEPRERRAIYYKDWSIVVYLYYYFYVIIGESSKEV